MTSPRLNTSCQVASELLHALSWEQLLVLSGKSRVGHGHACSYAVTTLCKEADEQVAEESASSAQDSLCPLSLSVLRAAPMFL